MRVSVADYKVVGKSDKEGVIISVPMLNIVVTHVCFLPYWMAS